MIEVLEVTKEMKVLNKPPSKVPQRKEMPIPVFGTRASNVVGIDEDRKKNKIDEFDSKYRKERRSTEDRGEMNVLENYQQLGNRKLYGSFVGKRIEYLSNFDMDHEETTM